MPLTIATAGAPPVPTGVPAATVSGVAPSGGLLAAGSAAVTFAQLLAEQPTVSGQEPSASEPTASESTDSEPTASGPPVPDAAAMAAVALVGFLAAPPPAVVAPSPGVPGDPAAASNPAAMLNPAAASNPAAPDAAVTPPMPVGAEAAALAASPVAAAATANSTGAAAAAVTTPGATPPPAGLLPAGRPAPTAAITGAPVQAGTPPALTAPAGATPSGTAPSAAPPAGAAPAVPSTTASAPAASTTPLPGNPTILSLTDAGPLRPADITAPVVAAVPSEAAASADPAAMTSAVAAAQATAAQATAAQATAASGGVAPNPLPVATPIVPPPAQLPTPPDQPVHQQVASAVLNLRASGDGTHSVSVALHPADLGPVNLHVRIVDGAMAISLASGNGATLDSIRSALPELRQELRQAGLPDVKLSLDLTAGEFTGQQEPRDAPTQQLRSNSFDTGGAIASHAPLRREGPGRPLANTGLDRWL